MSFVAQPNEVPGRPSPDVSLPDVQRRVMRFLMEEAGFAQVSSVNAQGFPVGRTMVAPINPDWSVTLVQRSVHKRLLHLRRNPRMEIIWTADPLPDSVNDRPHVYDYGLAVPRVVFLRGLAEFLDADETLVRYRAQTAANLAKGHDKAIERTDENVHQELVGIQVKPVQVRAEGFGAGAQSFTWTVD